MKRFPVSDTGNLRARARWFSVLAAVLALVVTATAPPAASAEEGAATLGEAIDAYERQDYDAAVTGFRPLADDGHTEAQYYMGMVYLFGNGVDMDPVQAETWFRRAYDQWEADADRGNPASMVEIALMLNAGLGVQRDDAKAVQWLRKAADLQYVEAWTEMGNMYLAGEGVPRDRPEAERWYRKAAAAGSANADQALKWLAQRSDRDVNDQIERHRHGIPY